MPHGNQVSTNTLLSVRPHQQHRQIPHGTFRYPCMVYFETLGLSSIMMLEHDAFLFLRSFMV
ncbi:MAG: hypothetical protein A2Z14_19460 [Chloroflexi bacterium RBG_16_48_8]|nr:MAG: hypothetical protein A2Z14_19460 [Chloroflexi bacterium RBG_16_48_8]